MQHLIVFRRRIHDPDSGSTPPQDPQGNNLDTLIVSDQVFPERHLRALRVTVDKREENGVTVIRGLQMHLEFLGNLSGIADEQGNFLSGEFVIIAQVAQVNLVRVRNFFAYLEQLKLALTGDNPIVLIPFKRDADFD